MQNLYSFPHLTLLLGYLVLICKLLTYMTYTVCTQNWKTIFLMLETLDYTICIGSTPTFLYFDFYLYSAYAVHCVYLTFAHIATMNQNNSTGYFLYFLYQNTGTGYFYHILLNYSTNKVSTLHNLFTCYRVFSST